MNKKKTGNPIRLIAFFLVALILVCIFGFSVDGWHIKQEATGGSPESSGSQSETSEDEKNEADGEDNTPTKVPDIYIPQYVSHLTGLETTEAAATQRPIAFVMNSKLQLFGISDPELICELPTEDGSTRMVVFTGSTDNLWKIGPIAPTRGYISNVAAYFHGILICGGNDSTHTYPVCDVGESQFDLTLQSGYHYSEHSGNIFTNCDMINAGLASLGYDRSVSTPIILPYSFTDFGAQKILGDRSAEKISITYSKESVTELIYNAESDLYTLNKNGAVKTDAINNEAISFSNCFILFADSVTYENANSSQMVMDTIGEGTGFYCSGGTVTQIRWSGVSGGVMTFYSLSGEKITVNRGAAYIGFVKSSEMDKVNFS